LKQTIIATTLLLTILACNSSKKNQAIQEPPKPEIETAPIEETPIEEGTIEDRILGTWEWFKTNCCYRAPKTTFADTSESKTIIRFKENNVLEYYRDDALTKTIEYKVGYGLMDDKRPTLTIDKRVALMYIRQDTLIIDYGYIDLQTEFYFKVKPK